MLDRHDSRHAVSDISAGKIGVFLFKDSQLSCILVHNCSKCRLKPGQMRTAFRIINIVTESEYIFMKFIYILKCHFNFYTIRGTFEINRIMEHLFLFIKIPDKSDDSFRLMIFDMLRHFQTLVVKNNLKLRIQISSLMEPALDFLCPEPYLLKDRVIRQKIHCCSCLLCLSDLRQQPVFQLDYRYTSLIPVMMDISVLADLYIHIRRKSIHDRRTHTVQTTACLIRRIIKFTAGMKRRVYKPCRRNTFLMHVHRNATSVVLHCR